MLLAYLNNYQTAKNDVKKGEKYDFYELFPLQFFWLHDSLQFTILSCQECGTTFLLWQVKSLQQKQELFYFNFNLSNKSAQFFGPSIISSRNILTKTPRYILKLFQILSVLPNSLSAQPSNCWIALRELHSYTL